MTLLNQESRGISPEEFPINTLRMSGRGKGTKTLRKKSTSQVTIHSKSHGTPPPEWLIDFPTKNVSDKIEIHKIAIGEKEKPEEMDQDNEDEEKLNVSNEIEDKPATRPTI